MLKPKVPLVHVLLCPRTLIRPRTVAMSFTLNRSATPRCASASFCAMSVTTLPICLSTSDDHSDLSDTQPSGRCEILHTVVDAKETVHSSSPVRSVLAKELQVGPWYGACGVQGAAALKVVVRGPF